MNEAPPCKDADQDHSDDSTPIQASGIAVYCAHDTIADIVHPLPMKAVSKHIETKVLTQVT